MRFKTLLMTATVFGLSAVLSVAAPPDSTLGAQACDAQSPCEYHPHWQCIYNPPWAPLEEFTETQNTCSTGEWDCETWPYA